MQLTEHDQAVSERLAMMQADGWREVRNMDAAQLEAFLSELDGTGRHYDWQHPFVLLRDEAVKAVLDVQRERRASANQRWFDYQTRTTHITSAAQRVREAIELIESANNIPDYSEKPPALPSLDVSTATDDELQAVHAECLGITRETPTSYAADAESIALLKSPASKAIANELKGKAAAYDERRKRADELLSLIAAERQRRESDRAAQEAAQSPEALAERVAMLESRLAQMEV